MKTKQQMQQESKQLKKTLLFHNTIMSEIRKKYQNVDNRKARQLISKLVAGKILKKYHLVTMAKKEFGFSTKLIRTNMTRADKLKYNNIKHQYLSLRALKEKIDEDSIVLQIDFAENYMCKFSNDIQAVHFGDSHQQVSLHTGVAHTKNGVVSVCTISSSMRHDPSAIWAHLKKVLPYLKQQNTAATTLHVISDGPTTQYRSKNNFFFLSKVPYELGFKKVTWNFLEAGHGKGPADGIGAAVKRQADSLVAKGIDLPTGKVLYEQLLNQQSTVKLMYITEGEIEEMDSLLPDDLLTIKGTMQIHQIVSTRPEEISWRVLSCFCADPHPCQCFGLKKVNILGAQNMETALGSPSSSTLTSTSQPIIDLHEGLIGSWCVVRYDGDPYPGIIQDVDPEGCALVRTMSHIGKKQVILAYERRCYLVPARRCDQAGPRASTSNKEACDGGANSLERNMLCS
ncbi:uncharacterized protein LOC121546167 [Coregonus clupeaformis]|uniref:uncharacterized protein LOC121546167 n=1 Tax=Coregonus clupeaformis TaxID=59861 RepID=UPI001E1C375A|nr:uncharacterized protein LOC121546167 [Coregonus clupeaformis]